MHNYELKKNLTVKRHPQATRTELFNAQRGTSRFTCYGSWGRKDGLPVIRNTAPEVLF